MKFRYIFFTWYPELLILGSLLPYKNPYCLHCSLSFASFVAVLCNSFFPAFIVDFSIFCALYCLLDVTEHSTLPSNPNNHCQPLLRSIHHCLLLILHHRPHHQDLRIKICQTTRFRHDKYQTADTRVGHTSTCCHSPGYLQTRVGHTSRSWYPSLIP